MRRFMMSLAIALTISATNVGRSGEDGHGSHCPRCHGVCYPTVTKGTEEKKCWEVETKTICIPKVRFPWESKCCNKGCGKEGCVPPKCGRTKCVNVLVQHKYECSTCKYSWDVDGDKYDNGNSDKARAIETPTPAEASLPHSNRRVAPAAFDQTGSATPARASLERARLEGSR